MHDLLRKLVYSGLAQIYVASIGIFLLPVYLGLLGNNGFGILAIFTTLLAWLQILDMGASAAITREIASNRVALENHNVGLIKSSTLYFSISALLITALVYFNRVTIATQWFNDVDLDFQIFVDSLSIMAFALGVRWLGSGYKATLLGYEDTRWISISAVIFATKRFVLPIPCLIFIGGGIIEYLCWQTFVFVCENICNAYRCMSIVSDLNTAKISIKKFDCKKSFGLVRAAVFMGISSTLWVISIQLDRIICSHYLPINEFGVFSLIVTAAGATMVITNPVAAIILPRLTYYYVSKLRYEFDRVYSASTQLVTAIGFSATAMLFNFSNEVLLVWTGDANIATHHSVALSYYSLGYGFLIIAAFPYYMQYALNKLKLHLIGSFIFLIVLAPSLYYCFTLYGVVGMSVAWCVVNFVYLFLWCGFVHGALMKNFHLKWFVNDFSIIAIVAFLVANFVKTNYPPPENRAELFAYIPIVCIVVLFLSFFACSEARKAINRILKNNA